jgi:hypothetical protein
MMPQQVGQPRLPHFTGMLSHMERNPHFWQAGKQETK